jgi:hypothetical protein
VVTAFAVTVYLSLTYMQQKPRQTFLASSHLAGTNLKYRQGCALNILGDTRVALGLQTEHGPAARLKIRGTTWITGALKTPMH